ncbi:DnaA regulatory inactivator Hda [uncultured Paraglaciecola sp.]|uniref:DnaA regulatory inactivator Hda n=1 Tax=uncultured Paraglaciecola sp. TaxID=1765024 RepID=UPI0026356E5C|nr:DnaA regulatory inactivator Hda [uncultured Paraglaciecola sp.]
MGQVNNQLTLPVGLKDTESFASFIAGQNVQACSHLNALFSQNEGEQTNNWLTYLFSDSGLGKSHLLYATCQQAELMDASCIYFSFNEKPYMSPDMLLGLEDYRLICLDDIEKLQGEREWQVAVFDLINRVKEQAKCSLVITGNQPPKQLSLELPDLISRLSWGTNFQLFSLTDEQRQQALIVKAQHRGLNMSKEVAKFLVNHWQRDMPALIASLDILDEQSLQQQRKLSIPFVKAILAL